MDAFQKYADSKKMVSINVKKWTKLTDGDASFREDTCGMVCQWLLGC